MLKFYGWNLCPHCHMAAAWLKEHHIPFEYHEIEEEPEEVVRKVIEINGGDDWVAPTLEFEGKWRPGEVFDAAKLERDLAAWGIVPGRD